MTLSIPNDVESLQALVRQLHEALHKSQRENEQLLHRLQVLLKARFGPRADRVDPNQLALFATEILEQVEKPSPKPTAQLRRSSSGKPNGHGRRRLPADLPREQVVHDLSEEEKRCPCCGEMRVRIGQEVSEQLDIEPAKLWVIEHIRPTYACRRCEGQVQTASKPLQPIEKGLAGPGLLAQVITSKFGDHLPLYRQEDILGRSGQAIPRSTTCGWLASCASLVRPLYERMKELVLASKVVHTDDTPVPVLDEKRGKTREGRIWTYVGDLNHPYTVFDYTPTHSRDGPSRFFGPYAGYIQADAFSGYDHLFKSRGEGVPAPAEVGCWAHVRRKFVEAQSSDALRSCTAVAMIRLLYEVEAEAKERISQEEETLDSAEAATATETLVQSTTTVAEAPLDEAAATKTSSDAAERHLRAAEIHRELRQEKSVPHLAKIKAWMEEQRVQVLPKSPIGQAIDYALSNWAALSRYTEDGDLAPDNNAAENALRPIVLGRKNWLFAGSDNGGRTGAILASLVASCKRHGLDPFSYLRDLLTRIAATPISQLDQFLPDRWKAEHIKTSPTK